MHTHTVRHEKFGVFGPAIAALGQPYLFLAKRLAVGGTGVMPVRRAISDMALDDNERRRILGTTEILDGLAEPLEIVDVANAQHVPAVGKEARRYIVAEGEIGVSFDGHAVIVIEPAKIPEHEVTGKRCCFV